MRLSQEELAERIGINVTNLGQIERGQANPKITTVISILEALNIPFDALPTNATNYKEIKIRY